MSTSTKTFEMSAEQVKQAAEFRAALNAQQAAATIKSISDALKMPVDSTVFIRRAIAMADVRGAGDDARRIVRKAAPCAAWPAKSC